LCKYFKILRFAIIATVSLVLSSVKSWHSFNLDFKALINLKMQLFDSPDLKDDNTVPISEFRRIRGESENVAIKQSLAGTEDQVMEIIKTEASRVDLNLFSDLVDLFVYLPKRDVDVN
jgi:hypothetical protein